MGELLKQLMKFYRIFILVIFPFWVNAQTFNPKISEYIKQVENPYNFLLQYEKFGVKDTYHYGLDSTFFWLKKNIEALGFSANEIIFNYNDGEKNVVLRNLEFVKKGDIDSCIVVCGHYDSKIGPGVNDNGSGNFAIYQMAKLMKPIKSKYSIRFIYFTGEEVDYLGSKNYVSRINKDSIPIKFVFNLDQLGGSIDQDNSYIKCERDESSFNKFKSDDITNIMSKIYTLYTSIKPIIAPAYASDYLAFRDAGYVITGLYQASTFAQYHTSNDLLKYMEIGSLTEITKGALAFLLFMSESRDILEIDDIRSKQRMIKTYYANNTLHIISNQNVSFKLFDPLGKNILSATTQDVNSSYFLPDQTEGLYFLFIQSEESRYINKLFIQH